MKKKKISTSSLVRISIGQNARTFLPFCLADMVRSIDVESAIRKEKLVDLDSRTEFAAQLEEIESKIGEESDISRLEADIHVDSRVPPEGRERFLRARCRVLQEEVNRLQKAANQAQEKFHRTKRTEQEKTDALAKSDKNAEKMRKELDKLKQSQSLAKRCYLSKQWQHNVCKDSQ